MHLRAELQMQFQGFPGGPEAHPWVSSDSVNSSFYDEVQLLNMASTHLPFANGRLQALCPPDSCLPKAVSHVDLCTHPPAFHLYLSCPRSGNVISTEQGVPFQKARVVSLFSLG